jgi:hypothetical protein
MSQDKIYDLPYVGGGSEYEARWRTLIADTFISEPALDSTVTASAFLRARNEDVESFEAWRDYMFETPRNGRDSDGNSPTDILINRFNAVTRLSFPQELS